MDLSLPASVGPGAASPASQSPRAAYVHLPFCRHRCGYCNFTLEAGRDYLVDRFLAALRREVERLPVRTELDTLFLGGGTPSHLQPGQLAVLKEILGQRFFWGPAAEISAECNPNDLTDERVAALAELGVNRFSLGVQSLDGEKLARLERDHTPHDVRTAVERVRQVGGQVSLDLIFAAPGESRAQWQQDLQSALDLEPNHLSTYELTFEKGTQFWNRLQAGRLAAADEDLRAQMYLDTIERVTAAGLEHYEVSSFAIPGARCRHNQVYWNGQAYWAFGPGAAAYVAGQRTVNHRSTLRYIRSLEHGEDPVAERETLQGLEAARERLVVGMRLRSGVDVRELQQSTGYSLDAILGPAGEVLHAHRLLEIQDGRIRLTDAGLLLADGVATRILSQAEATGGPA